MTKIEINIDRGFGEKKFIISEKPIVIDPGDTQTLLNEYKPDVMIFALNGKYSCPFEKGSRILRELRQTSNVAFENWKLLFSLPEKSNNYFTLLDLSEDFEKEYRNDWGVWVNSEGIECGLPLMIAINYPTWEIKNQWKNQGYQMEWISDKLSSLYRIVFSSLDILKQNVKNPLKTILSSDLGGSMLNQTKGDFTLQSIRIKIFSEVITNWLGNSIEPNSVIVAFGEGINNDMLVRAWGDQADQNKDSESEFGEAIKLRTSNLELCKRISSGANSNTSFNRIKHLVDEAITVFNSNTIALATDLIQTRALAEGLAAELNKYYGLKSDQANLFAYTERLEQSKKVSPWITSYLHVLRQLGNEAAHYKTDSGRRPEKPVGKDLVVIHAALNRILSFSIHELDN